MNLIYSNGNYRIEIHDSITFQIKSTLLGHTNHICRLFQLKNNDIVSGSEDKTVRVWDWNKKIIKYNFTAHLNNVYGLVELPNGFLVTGGQEGQIIVWK